MRESKLLVKAIKLAIFIVYILAISFWFGFIDGGV